MEAKRNTPDQDIPIKCPVCPFPETTKNPCPQCGTNLEPLRRLRRLSSLLATETPAVQQMVWSLNRWRLSSLTATGLLVVVVLLFIIVWPPSPPRPPTETVFCNH